MTEELVKDIEEVKSEAQPHEPKGEVQKKVLDVDYFQYKQLINSIINKGKTYLSEGEQPPKGAEAYTGKKGGKYYLTGGEAKKAPEESGQSNMMADGTPMPQAQPQPEEEEKKIEPKEPEPTLESIMQEVGWVLEKAHNSGFEIESEKIKQNKETEEAKKPHTFKPAQWTHPNGHPRCLLCGDEERVGGKCEGLDSIKKSKVYLKSGEQDLKHLSVKAIIEFDGKILILKNSNSSFWDLPGGHVQEDESPEEALAREISEETGLSISEASFESSGDMKLGNESKAVLFYRVIPKNNQVKLSEEHQEYDWVLKEELDSIKLGKFRKYVENSNQENIQKEISNTILEGLKDTIKKSEDLLVNRFIDKYKILATIGTEPNDCFQLAGRVWQTLSNMPDECANTSVILKKSTIGFQDDVDRLDKVIFCDWIAHELHKDKLGDGSSQYSILDDLASVSKGLGEKERDDRLLVLKGKQDVLGFLEGVDVLQKGNQFDVGQSYWKLFYRAIKNGVESLADDDLVVLREWCYARI